MALEVEIEKQLPGFTLSTAFTAGGEPLGVLGGSGAGKTMTLRCVAGLETPTRGRIVLDGRVLFDSARGIDLRSRERRIGLLFQNYALFPHLTVAENVAFGLQQTPRAARAARVAEELARMQLAELASRYPHELSGGQQQRVALARALVIDPAALLLDEPFSALDTHLRSQLERQLLETLGGYRGVTLYVTHNIEEAYRIASNLLILSEGRVMACGPKQEILRWPPNSTTARLTGCKNISRARSISADTVEALDWGCRLRAGRAIAAPAAYVGIRAHHIRFVADASAENTFPCWRVRTSETPFRMTVYLRLGAPPGASAEPHLQAELFKEKWEKVNERPLPWYVQLAPENVFALPE
jgi:ABC-type sulfate/molybdate transport systems ATPase subunit